MMRASAPRPLALAGVTRNISTSDSVSHGDTYGCLIRPKGDRYLLDRWCLNKYMKRRAVPLSSLFSVPTWIYHLIGISMHLVFQGFPGCLFHTLPGKSLLCQSLTSMHSKFELYPRSWHRMLPIRRSLSRWSAGLVSQCNKGLLNQRRLEHQ